MRPSLVKKLCVGIALLSVNAMIPAFSYSTNNGNIYDSLGNIVSINGVNWSGFQDSGFIDELYGSIPFYALPSQNIPFGVIDMLTHPWDNTGTGVTKSNSVSFKTIRLPIQPNNLHDTTVNSHFRYDLTSATAQSTGNGVFCNTWDTQHCTAGLSVKESLYKVISEFQKNNINVLVDFHQTPIGRDGNVVETSYSLANYSADVTELAQQIKSRGLTNVIGIDVFNEPHNLNWFSASGSQPSWASVIQTAGLAVYQNNPNLLLFVEGPSSAARSDLHICVPLSGSSTPPSDPDAYTLIQNSSACGTSKYEVVFKADWGESFDDLLNTAQAALGNAIFDVAQFKNAVCGSNTAFCTWLLGDSQTNGHLVFSPHVYGQYVTTWQSTPAASPYRFDWNWGFLQKAGFPVVIGETGFLPSQSTDVSFFEQSVMPYLTSHHLNHNLTFWTWNTNSGDTGGVRADANTIGLIVTKEADLATLYNSGAVDTGTLSVTASSTSDANCNAASDTLLLDGSATGSAFTVSSGISQTENTGTHQIALTSLTSIPAGGGLTGYCTSTLNTSQVSITKGQTTSVTATYVYHAAPATGTIKVTASSTSDTKCSSASDTLYLDGSTAGSSFTVSSGISQITNVGTHQLALASATSPIPAGGGQSGTCTGSITPSQIAVTANQISPATVVYQYKAATGATCTLVSPTVTAIYTWSGKVDEFQIGVKLSGFTPDSQGNISVNGVLIMKNTFQQNFWADQNFPASYTQGTGSGTFSGSFYAKTGAGSFNLYGFLMDASPITFNVGDNPLASLTINGITCY